MIIPLLMLSVRQTKQAHWTCLINTSHLKSTAFTEQTNQRYMKKTGKEFKVTVLEIRKFMGICIIMGNLNYPRFCMYLEAKISYVLGGKDFVCTGRRSIGFPVLLMSLLKTRSFNIRKSCSNKWGGGALGITYIYWEVQLIID